MLVRALDSVDESVGTITDIVECADDGCFVVLDGTARVLKRLNADGAVIDEYSTDGPSSDGEQPFRPRRLVTTPNSGLMVLSDRRIRVYRPAPAELTAATTTDTGALELPLAASAVITAMPLEDGIVNAGQTLLGDA